MKELDSVTFPPTTFGGVSAGVSPKKNRNNEKVLIEIDVREKENYLCLNFYVYRKDECKIL